MIHIVIGTKAQLIKMAPVMRALRDKKLPYRYISTGQHRETIEDILNNFDLPGPDLTLYEGKDITSVFSMSIWFVQLLLKSAFHRKEIFAGDTTGIVLVHGDTISTLLGAVMSKLSGLRVGHIESGLRSFNYFHPFPEEITRVITFRLADFLFCPDESALDNIKSFKGEKINTGGNTLLDSLNHVLEQEKDLSKEPSASYGIVSIHRFENIRSKPALNRIIDLLNIVTARHKLKFVMHKPTENALQKHKLMDQLTSNKNIELLDRKGYAEFIRLLKKADFLISDGGSNQEECFYIGKPCLLMRKATERNEGLGENVVLGNYERYKIEDFTLNFSHLKRRPLIVSCSPSSTIVEHIAQFA